MTSTEFRAALDKLKQTQKGFARHIKVNPRTVRRWASGETDVPAVVSELVNAMVAALPE